MKRPRTPTPDSRAGEPVEASLAGGPGVGAGVRWIYAGADAAAIGEAEVIEASASRVELDLDEAGPFGVGARLVLESVDGGGPRWIVVVTGVSDRTVTARVVRAAAEERREYPRVHGAIPLRYRVSPGPDIASAWMHGEPVDGVTRAPSPWMEFSVTGLAFEDEPLAREGDTLLIELGVAGGPRRWRCVAGVVHVVPLPGARASGPTHRIALEFHQIPATATVALAEYTLRIQEEWMEGPGGE